MTVPGLSDHLKDIHFISPPVFRTTPKTKASKKSWILQLRPPDIITWSNFPVSCTHFCALPLATSVATWRKSSAPRTLRTWGAGVWLGDIRNGAEIKWMGQFQIYFFATPYKETFCQVCWCFSLFLRSNCETFNVFMERHVADYKQVSGFPHGIQQGFPFFLFFLKTLLNKTPQTTRRERPTNWGAAHSSGPCPWCRSHVYPMPLRVDLEMVEDFMFRLLMWKWLEGLLFWAKTCRDPVVCLHSHRLPPMSSTPHADRSLCTKLPHPCRWRCWHLSAECNEGSNSRGTCLAWTRSERMARLFFRFTVFASTKKMAQKQ